MPETSVSFSSCGMGGPERLRSQVLTAEEVPIGFVKKI